MGLVLSRRKGQSISIGPHIRVRVTELHRSSVKLHIEAPAGFDIVRSEVIDAAGELDELDAVEDGSQALRNEALVAEKVDGIMKGRPVVVPGVNLEGMTDEERDRAMARWLFSKEEKP